MKLEFYCSSIFSLICILFLCWFLRLFSVLTLMAQTFVFIIYGFLRMIIFIIILCANGCVNCICTVLLFSLISSSALCQDLGKRNYLHDFISLFLLWVLARTLSIALCYEILTFCLWFLCYSFSFLHIKREVFGSIYKKELWHFFSRNEGPNWILNMWV